MLSGWTGKEKPVNLVESNLFNSAHKLLSQQQILCTGNLPQAKTLLRFVLILISLQRWQHRGHNETKHFASPHLIGPQFLANQHETNQHKSAALIGLFHATSSVLLSVESYRNYRKPTQRGVQGYISSLQRRVLINRV